MSIERLREKITEKLEWGELATFVPNKKEPMYRWFYYKEGFAKHLILNLIDELKIKGTTLDPFCGSGTTLLACKQKGVDAIGFDVLPVCVFASYVKTKFYNIDILKEESRNLLGKKFEKLRYNFPPIMKRVFNKYVLEDIAFFLNNLDACKEKDFFLLALMNAAMKVSYAWKDGSVIKVKKHHAPPLRFMLKRTIKQMIKDIEKTEMKDCVILIRQCDARHMPLENESIDAIITSPPYLNQIDYTRVYEIENFFVSRIKEKPALRSIVDEKEYYFNDMHKVISEMFRVCKNNARVVIIVSNAYINGNIIESDLLLAEMASRIGFSVENIYILNKRYALEERTKKKGILRESMIILKKD